MTTFGKAPRFQSTFTTRTGLTGITVTGAARLSDPTLASILDLPSPPTTPPVARAARVLTQAQWRRVYEFGLGLRSGSTDTDIHGVGLASYAMDDGLVPTPFLMAPANWLQLLQGTIENILGFSGSSARHLLLVEGVRGNSGDNRYPGCFLKCSSRPQKIRASLPIGTNRTDALVTWVLAKI
ncbi:MAG: hypothetical protein QOC81_461 [Thermoanaerobaculia bacterium]|jgi:hypothetical protein|nr:hypothetical protein [Thermoanaerobaculia bacterium]